MACECGGFGYGLVVAVVLGGFWFVFGVVRWFGLIWCRFPSFVRLCFRFSLLLVYSGVAGLQFGCWVWVGGVGFGG